MSFGMQLSRRTFLRGLGTSIALPALEAMLPAPSFAKKAGAIPLRMGFAYVPNGVIMPQWTPEKLGSQFALPTTLQPLNGLQDKLQVLGGLDQDKAKANGDGAGDHARANATFLTGCQAKKTAGADIRIGISVDQVAAAKIGSLTKLPSLELSCDKSRRSGKCDSGYSCAYQFNLSWKSDSLPMAPEANPREVFDRLFGNGVRSEEAESKERRLRHERSILDFALQDAKRLQSKLGYTDKAKVEEYLEAVRDLEKRIERTDKIEKPRPKYPRPDGVPSKYEDHIRMMFDLMALAFQTDTTRISTFLLAHDGSNRSFKDIGVAEGHHSISHHRNDEKKIDKLAKIDRFYVQQFSYFLNKLNKAKEADGSSLLDHCMIVYGSGISDGNRHNHEDLPVLLAGGSAAGLKTGRHKRFDGIPMTNLYLSLLERMSVEAEALGDSTGKLADI
ncbi:MAG: hypothetical protein CMI31_01830 [Opitutae bacterium]|nr:hypothetical protein [Opitutae bacterium]|tara:strand:+ start:5301 stop:6638 length:1338 start_codon:yes stop_codon:yes gene_type:complete